MIPNEDTYKDIADLLSAHRTKLVEMEGELLRPYNHVKQMLATELHAASNSATLHT
jgi:hypothetical protein